MTGGRCLVVHHPGARRWRGGGFERLAPRLVERLGPATRCVRGDDGALAGELRALDAARDVLVVAGGDGTLHHALRALAEARGLEEAWPRLALLPAGSANDYARALAVLRGEPCGLESIARALAGGARVVAADLGVVECAPLRLVRGFALFAAAGLPCDWVRIADARWMRPFKRCAPALAYGIASLAVIARGRTCELSIATGGAGLDGGAAPQRLFAWFAAKARWLGGGLDLGADVRLDSGCLALASFPGGSRRALLASFLAARRGAGAATRAAGRVALRVHGPTALNLDGEIVALDGRGELDVTLRLLPAKLRWI